jgi:hypothetical protein
MDHLEPQIPSLHLQSPAVDFIENRLDKYHPAFSTPPSRFEPSMRTFIVDVASSATPEPPSLSGAMEPYGQSGNHNMLVATTGPATTAMHSNISPRPSPKPLEALDFWGLCFPEAMKRFTETHPVEPEQLVKLGCGIRDKSDWTQVFNRLDMARKEYSKGDNKFKLAMRTAYRNFGDNLAEPFHRLTKLIPGGGELGSAAVSPIIGCVQILLEVSRPCI